MTTMSSMSVRPRALADGDASERLEKK